MEGAFSGSCGGTPPHASMPELGLYLAILWDSETASDLLLRTLPLNSLRRSTEGVTENFLVHRHTTFLSLRSVQLTFDVTSAEHVKYTQFVCSSVMLEKTISLSNLLKMLRNVTFFLKYTIFTFHFKK